ncbi:MAG TPA: ATPase domain-containing protein [Methylomirabilota bacterium]|nr:ATPase domain-containing protein [Methylomirabilota bacterium]
MRLPLLVLIVLIIIPLFPSGVAAQPTPHYIVLFAHSYGDTAILNALPDWMGQKAADISKPITFRLSPTLGDVLHIYGGITFTLYLRASVSFFGTIAIQVTELTADGKESLVPNARAPDNPLSLDTRIAPVTFGVGIVDYQFQRGSSILLRIGVDQVFKPGVPLLVWDDQATPTNIRLPTISPTTAQLQFIGHPSFGHVFEADDEGMQLVRVDANINDPIGVYRFNSISFTMTAPNGTVITTQVNPNNSTDYTSLYSTKVSLNEGEWKIGITLRDISGDTYEADDNLWVAPFVPVLIRVVGSDNVSLQDATLNVTFDNHGTWVSKTNSTGWGSLSLPSSQTVGPLNVTIQWQGTETPSVLEVVGAPENPPRFLIIIQVYNPSIRVTMGGFPIPAARVTLTQVGTVHEVYTGPTGNADFKTIPSGNYTVRVDYLFATYEMPLSVHSNSLTTVPVPLPHRTILLVSSLLIIGLASTLTIRRRRSKLYPRDFSYFNEMTHGGLPEACFAAIIGDSGSGKSVLLNSLAGEHLASHKAIYITNTEYPDKIRENLVKLGVCGKEDVQPDKLIFIDAYSAVGGSQSKEPFSIDSHTDLTNLGLNISKCLEVAGPGADVYFDSLNALLSALRMEYLLNFLQSVAAKVKANNGKFCVTIGAGLEKGDLIKLEAATDCVIETELQESGGGQRRRMRIKKLRDRPYNDHWVRFQVQESKGIILLTTSKPPNDASKT